jgi:anti-sigma factor RsiW
VIHLRARRLLHALTDDTLAEDVELELRIHVASCMRCRRMLAEQQVAENLLRRIPPSIVPLETSPGAYVRLAALGRWTDEADVRDPEGWRLSFLGVATAGLLFCLAASAGTWAPTIAPTSRSNVNLTALPPDYAYVATNYR